MSYTMYYKGIRSEISSASSIKRWLIRNGIKVSKIKVYKEDCLELIDIGSDDCMMYGRNKYHYNDLFRSWIREKPRNNKMLQKRVARNEPMCKDVMKEDDFEDRSRVNKTYRALKNNCWWLQKDRSRNSRSWKNIKVRKQYEKKRK